MSKRCELQKEYYQNHGNYKGNGKYSDSYVKWLEDTIIEIRNESKIMRNKKTAVEWLIESIESLEYNVKNKIISTEDYDINLEWVKKKAKDLEKEQLEKEYDRGYNEAWDKTAPVKETVTMIDPPSGWKYGFPKPIPQDRLKDYKVWLVEQGYPQSEIDSLGEHFLCRYWEK
jgi:hypothetical protein